MLQLKDNEYHEFNISLLFFCIFSTVYILVQIYKTVFNFQFFDTKKLKILIL
jgi:hypothetical protein